MYPKRLDKFTFLVFAASALLISCGANAQEPLVPRSQIVKLSSTLWSDLRDMEFSGRNAYCVFFDGLTVLDLCNINSPSQDGQVELPKDGRKVSIWNQQAYVVSADSSLHLIDVSSASQPSLINSLKMPDLPVDVHARDNCLYVSAENTGLLVLDVSDPFNVAVIGSCQVEEFQAFSLFLHGNLAYVAGIGGLKVINIVVPQAPYLFGSTDLVPGAREIFVDSDSERTYAYLSDPLHFSILDVTNPRDISLLSVYEPANTLVDLQVFAGYAYLGLGYEEFMVLDIGERDWPTEVAALRVGDYTRGIFSHSGFIFVTDILGPTKIISVFNPDRPFVAGSWINPGSCKDAAFKDGFAYVMCGNSGLHILNVVDPEDPQMLSTLHVPYNNNDVDVEGEYVYVTALLPGMQVVDVSDPLAPAVISQYQPDGYSYGVEVEEGCAYLRNSENDIQIIDVQNPLSLVTRGEVETPGNAQGLCVRGSYVYAADQSAGLAIINASDKDTPYLVKSVPLSGDCTNVFSAGDLLFLSCDGVGMQICDITDPETPDSLGFYSNTKRIEDLHVEDHYAYLSMEDHTVEVIDIASPSSPSLAASYDTLDNPGSLTVSDQKIYLCDGRSFKILSFLPPFSPPGVSAKRIESASSPSQDTTSNRIQATSGKIR